MRKESSGHSKQCCTHKSGLNLKVPYFLKWASLVALVVKNPPAMQETQEMHVRSLGGEDPWEEGTATHSSILVWRIPWTEKLVGYSP